MVKISRALHCGVLHDHIVVLGFKKTVTYYYYVTHGNSKNSELGTDSQHAWQCIKNYAMPREMLIVRDTMHQDSDMLRISRMLSLSTAPKASKASS